MKKAYDYAIMKKRIVVIKNVLKLRRGGMSFAKIGKAVGKDKSSAFRIYHTNKNYKDLNGKQN